MGHMGKGVSCVILKIEMGYLEGWGTWAMGHMIIIGQMGIIVNTVDRDGAPWGWGTWAMGHMVNVVMCLIMCNFLNTAWIFTKILLHIDIDVFYLNIQ